MEIKTKFKVGQWVMVKIGFTNNIHQIIDLKQNTNTEEVLYVLNKKDSFSNENLSLTARSLKPVSVADKFSTIAGFENWSNVFAKLVSAFSVKKDGYYRLYEMWQWLTTMSDGHRLLKSTIIRRLAWRWYLAQPYMGEFEDEEL